MKKRFNSKLISYILIISFVLLAIILSLIYFNITGHAILGLPIYIEGFESGNLNSWDSYRNLNGGDLAVTTEDPRSGLYSLRFNIDDTSNMYIYETSNPPFSGQNEGNVSFYIKFNSNFLIGTGETFYLFPGGAVMRHYQ